MNVRLIVGAVAALYATTAFGANVAVMRSEGEGLTLTASTTEPEAAAPLTLVVAKRYTVREDPRTGRLIRVYSGRSQRTVAAQSAAEESGALAVQGARDSRLSAVGGPVDLESLVQEAGRRYDVDPELIRAVIRQESAFNPLAVSAKGAQGLMQLMPATAKRLGVQDAFDPAENVLGGVKLLRQLMDRYEGDLALALAAYNAGEGAVDKYGGQPPYFETRDYVKRITSSYGIDGAPAQSSEPEEAPLGHVRAAVVADGSLVFEKR